MAGMQIGELLVQRGVLSEPQVSHILRVQKASGRPFGDLAERLYGISPKMVEDAWVEQYVRTVGVTDLASLEFDTECLRVLNRRQAWQFQMLPVRRDDDRTLNVATDARSLIRAVKFAANRIDDAVFLLVAESDQLRDFLMKHYPVPEYFADYARTRREDKAGPLGAGFTPAGQ